MSDCLDHESEAWDDLLVGRTADGQDERPLYSSYSSYSDYQSPFKAKKVSCRYCGKKKLRWVNTPEGWRLMTKKKKIHKCKAYTVKRIH